MKDFAEHERVRVGGGVMAQLPKNRWISRTTERIKHYQSEDTSQKGWNRDVEVRFDDESCQTIDEVCTSQIHLERMDSNSIWMNINGYHVWIRTPRAAIQVTGYPSDCTEYVVKQQSKLPE